MKKISLPFLKLLLFLCFAFLGLSACNLPRSAANTTATLNVTQAYQTVEARLTQAALASPAAKSPVPPTETKPAATTQVSSDGTPTITPTPKASATTATKLCDQAEPGTPIDVTIQDDTQMLPGQTFTKVWRLRNSGTCTWSKDYSIAVFSGESMDAPQPACRCQIRSSRVRSMDISVDLVAPALPALTRATGSCATPPAPGLGSAPAAARLFGCAQSRRRRHITVTPGTPTPATATATSDNTYPPATEQSTPGVQVSGSNNLVPSDRINLDTNQINAGAARIYPMDRTPKAS